MKLPLRRWAPFFFACLSLLSCKSMETGARESFSKAHTCPEERVEVRRRADVTRGQLRKRPKPSAEIQADPGRLKMWEAEQERINKNIDGMCDIYEARGCGYQELLCCTRPPKHMDRVSCGTEDYADGVSKW